MLQESHRVELKRELNDKLEKETAAFLNADGGALYIGVDDNGAAVGIDDLDASQLSITNRIKDNILPSTLGLFEVIDEEYSGKKVIKVLISSGPEKPYCGAVGIGHEPHTQGIR